MLRPSHLLAALSLALAVGCASRPEKAQAPSVPAAGLAGRKLVVIGINDTHGGLLAAPPPRWLGKATRDEIGGADWFGGYVNVIRQQARSAGGEAIVLDGGDLFQGTLISNQFQGRSVIDAYNAIGIAAAAVGNHEFDFGLPVLQERIAQARFPVLAANLFLKGTDTRPDWVRPTAVIEAAGVKVGIIGLSTVETPTSTNPINVAGFDFRAGGPIAARLADELRAQGCTVVLIAAHIGPKGENEVQHVAEAVAGKVDAIVSGHHHEMIGPPPLIVANVPIVQSGSKLVAFSLIELTLDAAGRVATFAVNDGTFPRPGGPQPILHSVEGLPAQWRGVTVVPDGRVAAVLRDYDVQVKKLRESAIGSTTVTLQKGGRDDLIANLCADALRSGLGGGLKADFAFQNSGGLRIPEIAAGPITFGQLFDLYPFDNQQIVVQLPAAEVRNALETVLRLGKGPLRVSGLRYRIDWEKFGAAKNHKGAPPGAIVTEVIDANTSKPLCRTLSCSESDCVSECAAGSFSLSVTDFLANGGDGLVMLKDAPRQIGSALARDIIVAFVKEHSPLTAPLLGSLSTGAEPRIVIVGSSKGSQGME